LALATLLVAVNWYFLWETRSDQISGDVLIHLIFARNFAEGRWFEFSDGQISRANTTFLWEWILAVLGLITGQIRSNEGFLTLARLLAVACTTFAGWKMFQWGKRLGLLPGTSALVCVFVLLNPVTFYWTAVNPMETSLALVFAVLSAMWISDVSKETPSDRGRPAGFENQEPPSPSHAQHVPHETTWKSGLIGGLLIFGLSQTRPEMLAAAPIAALALLLGQGWIRWKLAIVVIAVPFLLTALQALWLAMSGFPVLPSSSLARRLMMLTYDTSPLPILGIPANLDAIKLLILWSPLLLASAYGAFFGNKELRPLYFFVLGLCAFSGLFFSFHQFTTWQGRYMLPALVVLVTPAVAVLSRRNRSDTTDRC